MQKKYLVFGLYLIFSAVWCFGSENSINKKVQDLINKMTLEEKIGQLVQVSGNELTGPQGEKIDVTTYAKEGKIGSCLNVHGYDNVLKMQKAAVEGTRLKIPLLFGMDVVHGYKTIFPVPLGMASSWDIQVIKKAQKIAAKEAASAGINWTFAPMLDIARDPRWGRVVETFSEDPYLVSIFGKASVEAFQKNNLSDEDSLMATAKHYVGYGAVQAGREYYTVDISKRTLWEVYMPPFKAAVDANVASIMPAFTSIDGVPMSANKRLITTVLRKKWHFDGIVVSDWDAIHELINHGVAENDSEATMLAINAGINIDMMGGDYMNYLPELVKEKKVSMDIINKAVSEILKKKFEMGLFDNPYKYCNADKEKKEILSEENRKAAREVAEESIVLLKNQDNLLPLKKDIKSIAVIGPLADDKKDPIGPWSALGSEKDTISLLDALKEILSNKTKIYFQMGSEITKSDNTMMEAAVNAASKADVIIAVMGESRNMSGEAASRSSFNLPEPQKELLKKLYTTGKPIVLVLMNGRPLVLTWEDEHIPAILEAWYPGTEAGHAIADIIFGQHNPSAKLTITFPRSVGQIPIFYNHFQSGRPATEDTISQKYVSKYIDIDNDPLYPFGYGLSYTTFSYSPISLSKKEITPKGSLIASVDIQNTGNIDGYEIVQLYIRDNVASVARPVMELKEFKKVFIKAGKTLKVSFLISPDSLKFYNQDMKEVLEIGTFDIYIGPNSRDYQKETFTLTH